MNQFSRVNQLSEFLGGQMVAARIDIDTEIGRALTRAEAAQAALDAMCDGRAPFPDGDKLGPVEAEALDSRAALMRLVSEMLGVDARRVVEVCL